MSTKSDNIHMVFFHAKIFQCEQFLRYLETLQCFSTLAMIRFSHRGCELQAVNTYNQACCSIYVDSARFQDFVFRADADRHNGMVEYFVNVSALLEPLQKFKDESKFYIQIESKEETGFNIQVFYTEGAVCIRSRKRDKDKGYSTPKKRCKLFHHGNTATDVEDVIITPDDHTQYHKEREGRQEIEEHFVPENDIDCTTKVKTLTYTVSSNNSSSTHPKYLNIIDIPDSSTNIAFSMDAASLNVLFRESSIVEEKVCIMAYPPRKEIGFYTGGERGELFDRFATTPVDSSNNNTYCGNKKDEKTANGETAGLDIIWHTTPTSSNTSSSTSKTNTVTMPNSATDGVIRERYSNRLIRSFGKVMSVPNRIHCSFSPGRPLIMHVNHPHMRIMAHIVPWSPEWARISSPLRDEGKNSRGNCTYTNTSQYTKSKEFIQTSRAQFVMQRPGKRELILSELYRDDKPSPPLHKISLFGSRPSLREGTHERMVRLHLPLPMTAEFWKRHDYCADDVRKTLRCYRTPVWHLNLLLHLPIATTAVKISHEHRDGLTYGGRQASVDQLMIYFKNANMYTGSALNSSAWPKHSSLKYSKCTHKPPLSVHSVNVNEWNELMGIFQRRIKIECDDDRKLIQQQSDETRCDLLRFPAYRYDTSWEWKGVEVIPLQWHTQADLMELVRVVPETFYFQQLPHPTCAIQSLPRCIVKEEMYVQTLESFYVSDATKKS